MAQHETYGLAEHQLELGLCPTGCQWRTAGQGHWHEECACGAEFILDHDVVERSTLVVLQVLDHYTGGF